MLSVKVIEVIKGYQTVEAATLTALHEAGLLQRTADGLHLEISDKGLADYNAYAAKTHHMDFEAHAKHFRHLNAGKRQDATSSLDPKLVVVESADSLLCYRHDRPTCRIVYVFDTDKLSVYGDFVFGADKADAPIKFVDKLDWLVNMSSSIIAKATDLRRAHKLLAQAKQELEATA